VFDNELDQIEIYEQFVYLLHLLHVFDNELDQIEIYEQFVYLLHLLQLGKIKYQKDTNTLYL